MKLSDEQQLWLSQEVRKLIGYQGSVIYAGLSGSRLYGLESEESDTDIRLVYVPSNTDLLTGDFPYCVQGKNAELNIEYELKSIQSFFTSLKHADTVCVDMLFTPEQFWLTGMMDTWMMDEETHYAWEDIYIQRGDIISKNMEGLVGYIKTQAAKYTNKRSRFDTMTTLLDYVNQCSGTVILDLVSEFKEIHDLDFLEYHVLQAGTQYENYYLEVCGKDYVKSMTLKEFKQILERRLREYGKRVKNSAFDRKAISHSIRAMYQMIELVKDKSISFPMKEPNLTNTRAVKFGEMSEHDSMDLVDTLYDESMSLLKASDLPDAPNIKGMVISMKYYITGE